MPVEFSRLATHYARRHNPLPPRHLGTRYDLSGRFLPEPGNTIVCHLEPDSATEQALVDARATYERMADARILAFTPAESYHMTLFQGVIEGRRQPPYWPADIPEDASIAETTTILGNRLAAFSGAAPFKVEAITALPTGLLVQGITAADRQAMAEWRDAFADIMGYRHPDHDNYVFHITMAYMVDWIEDDALPVWQAMLDEALEDIRRRAPVIALRAPAFCSFQDMNWFEELLPFDTNWPANAASFSGG